MVLKGEFEVCKAGTLLTVELIDFLKLLFEKLAVYKLKLKAKWMKTGIEILFDTDEFDDESGDEEDMESDTELS